MLVQCFNCLIEAHLLATEVDVVRAAATQLVHPINIVLPRLAVNDGILCTSEVTYSNQKCRIDTRWPFHMMATTANRMKPGACHCTVSMAPGAMSIHIYVNLTPRVPITDLYVVTESPNESRCSSVGTLLCEFDGATALLPCCEF